MLVAERKWSFCASYKTTADRRFGDDRRGARCWGGSQWRARWLHAHGHGDDARFAALVRATWHRIPADDRRRIVAYWGEADALTRQFYGVPCPLRPGEVDPRPEPPGFPAEMPAHVRAFVWPDLICPHVELVYGWAGGRHDDTLDPPTIARRPHWATPPADHAGRALGMIGASGHLLRFRAGAVDRMPDDVVQDLVAHPLAYVLIRADGRLLTEQAAGDAGAAESFAADAAALMGVEWGFGTKTIEDWAAGAGLHSIRIFDIIEPWGAGA